MHQLAVKQLLFLMKRHLVAIGSGGDPRKMPGLIEKIILLGHPLLGILLAIYKYLQVVKPITQLNMAMILLFLLMLV